MRQLLSADRGQFLGAAVVRCDASTFALTGLETCGSGESELRQGSSLHCALFRMYHPVRQEILRTFREDLLQELWQRNVQVGS
jgi:hypothetical protein